MQRIRIELDATVNDEIAQAITKHVEEIKRTLSDVKAKNKVSLTTEVVDLTKSADLLDIMMQLNPTLQKQILKTIGQE
jgi:ribosomal protein S5